MFPLNHNPDDKYKIFGKKKKTDWKLIGIIILALLATIAITPLIMWLAK